MSEYNYIISYSVDGGIFQFPSTPRCEEFIKSYTLDEASSGKIEAIDNSFTFVGADFDKLVDAPFGTKFTMKIQRLPYQDNYYTGIFYIKDCEVNYDKKIIVVKIKTEDYLTEFQNVLDKEINLSDIAIKKTNIQHSVPPLLQIYVLGDDKLTNYQLGTYWEQDCEIVEKEGFPDSEWDSESITGNNYVQRKKILYMQGTYNISQLWYNIGYFINGFNAEYLSEDGLYFITIAYNSGSEKSKFEIRTVEDSTILWNSEEYTYEDAFYYFDNIMSLEFTSIGSQTANFTDQKFIYIRLIVSSTWKQGFELRENAFQICENPLYKKIVRNYYLGESPSIPVLDNPMSIIGYSQVQTNQTKYNKNTNGKYFSQKVSTTDFEYVPVGMGLWGGFSIWVRADELLHDEIIDEVIVNYETSGFKIDDVFNAIFTHFNLPLRYASIYFNSTTNPILNNARLYPIITQVTNLNTNKETVQESTLATKNNITLIELIQYLKDRFNLSYHLKDGYFNLEHIYYYENNQSYTTNTAYTDLTTKINQRVSKAWSFGMNQVKYNVKSFKRKVFKQDTASENLGNGVIDTDYCEDIISVDYGRFFDDIGYLLSGTNEIRDGFFFGLYGSNYRLYYQQIAIKGYICHIQNYANSLTYVLKHLHNYNMQGDTFLLDGESINVLGFFRGKIQEIEVNMGVENDNADIYKLVKTDLGIAYIIKKVVNCDKKTVKYTLSHDID
jgi:hypothetical protein